MNETFLIDEPRVELRPQLDELAKRLAAFIPKLPTSSPVLITGDWGSGKTSLLRAIEAHIKTLPNAPPVIWFDAWHHEGQAVLLPSLLRRLWDCRPEAKKSIAELQSLWSRVWRCASLATMKAAPTIAQFLPIPYLAQLLKAVDAPKLLSALEQIEHREAPEDPLSDLRVSLQDLITKSWGGATPIIVVDDLDRCSPVGAVDLIDGIRMLVGSSTDLSCRFVVAIDRTVVVKAISAKFARLPGYDGNRYLEKIFPIEFRVPSATTADDAIALLKQLIGGDAAIHDLLPVFKQPAFANPRLMIRSINRYRLVRDLEMADPQKDADNRALVEWIAATERWPRLRAIQSRRPDFWERAQRGFEPGGPREKFDPELAELWEELGALEWLRTQQFPTQSDRMTDFNLQEQRLRRWGL